MKVFGLWERLTRIIFFDGKAVTVEPAPQTVQDKTITIPDVSPATTQEIVLSAQAQTLTNKTISGATNTLQAIPGAVLNAGSVTNTQIADDTIALTKMAADVANQQRVLKRQVTTGAVISGNTIPDSGTVLTDSAVNNNVVLKTVDRVQTYSTQVSITGTSTELFVNSRVGVVEVTSCASATINQIMVENTDGAYLVILNRTGAPILVDNDAGASAGRRIITGTGGPINLADKAALFLVYNANLGGALNRWTVVGGTGGGAGGTVTQVTTPVAHGFTVTDKGKALYLNGATYTAAIATASNTAEVVGILAGIIDADTFELATGGAIEVISGDDFEGGSVPAKGTVVFLSDLTAGKMTATEPTVVGSVSKPLGIIFDTNKMFFYNMRGSVVGGANVRTQIAVNSNATTTIQSAGSYTAGSLDGWIEWSATTPIKFYFQAQFVKNGANNNYNIAAQFVGDTPPLGFAISITAAGDIQVTLPTIAGFTTGFANFALNAPAVGTTLPITVAGSNVVSNYKNVTGAYTVTTNDYYISATGASAYTISLPAASSVSGKMFVIKSRLNAGIILTIDPNGSETIDGALTRSIYQNEAVHIVSNGTSWEIF